MTPTRLRQRLGPSALHLYAKLGLEALDDRKFRVMLDRIDRERSIAHVVPQCLQLLIGEGFEETLHAREVTT